MATTNTTIGASIKNRTKTVQMQYVNRETVNCPCLHQVIEAATPIEALDNMTIHAIDSSDESVLTAVIKVTYVGGVPTFDLMGPSPQPEFMMGASADPTWGPEQEDPFCEMWRGVLQEYMKIRNAKGYGLKWTVLLQGPYAQEIRDRFDLTSSNIVCRAVQPLIDPLENSHDSDIAMGILSKPSVADQEIPR